MYIDPIAISQLQAAQQWVQGITERADRQQQEDDADYPAQWLGYDADRGLHRIQRVGNNEVTTATSITSGGLAPGQPIDIAYSENYTAIDNTPYRPVERVPELEEEQVLDQVLYLYTRSNSFYLAGLFRETKVSFLDGVNVLAFAIFAKRGGYVGQYLVEDGNIGLDDAYRLKEFTSPGSESWESERRIEIGELVPIGGMNWQGGFGIADISESGGISTYDYGGSFFKRRDEERYTMTGVFDASDTLNQSASLSGSIVVMPGVEKPIALTYAATNNGGSPAITNTDKTASWWNVFMVNEAGTEGIIGNGSFSASTSETAGFSNFSSTRTWDYQIYKRSGNTETPVNMAPGFSANLTAELDLSEVSAGATIDVSVSRSFDRPSLSVVNEVAQYSPAEIESEIVGMPVIIAVKRAVDNYVRIEGTITAVSGGGGTISVGYGGFTVQVDRIATTPYDSMAGGSQFGVIYSNNNSFASFWMHIQKRSGFYIEKSDLYFDGDFKYTTEAPLTNDLFGSGSLSQISIRPYIRQGSQIATSVLSGLQWRRNYIYLPQANDADNSGLSAEDFNQSTTSYAEVWRVVESDGEVQFVKQRDLLELEQFTFGTQAAVDGVPASVRFAR